MNLHHQIKSNVTSLKYDTSPFLIHEFDEETKIDKF